MVDYAAAVTATHDLLKALGVEEDDHNRDTPDRVARYWAEALAGYDIDPTVHLTRVFPAGGEGGLVISEGIDVRSVCAHHLLPITGVATVAYRPQPGSPIVGLSKLTRLVDGYARRLQVQERLGQQVAAALGACLDPAGAACVITATHGCMTVRGVGQPAATATTVAVAGRWETGHPDMDCVLARHARATRAT